MISAYNVLHELHLFDISVLIIPTGIILDCSCLKYRNASK